MIIKESTYCSESSRSRHLAGICYSVFHSQVLKIIFNVYNFLKRCLKNNNATWSFQSEALQTEVKYKMQRRVTFTTEEVLN
jgi:hypothetical protein